MTRIGLQIENAERRWLRHAPQRERALGEMQRMADGEAADWRAIDSASRVKRRLERLGRSDEADAIDDGPSAAFNPLERIIGESQLSGIEFMERGLVAARSVARVEIRSVGRLVGFGSGVMISPELFMTNNHVIGDEATAAASIIQFEYLNSATGPREPLPFRLRPDRFFVTHADLDFTIIAVEPVNADGIAVSSRGWCPLIPGSGKAIVSERVNIIQHPQGERMQVSLRDNTVLAIVDDFIHYQADTLRGSSGAPVLNDQWEMAALHHSGVPRRDELGRILMTDGNRWTGRDEDADRIDWIANEGVRVSRIIDEVNRRALQPEQRRIWDGASQPPRPLNLWDLFGGIDRPKGAMPEFDEHGMARIVDEAGDAAWLFRLSFGPVKTPAADLPASTAPVAPPVSSSSSLSPARPAASSGGDPRGAAEAIFERFRSDQPYYDPAEDGEMQARYYEGVDWSADPAELAPALQRRLAETHDGSISYTRARLEFLYPSIDLHGDGLLHNIYSGIAFDPVEAIGRELARATPFAESIGVEFTATSFEALVDRDALWEQVEAEAAVPFNCEHVVCQSWFGKRAPMRADLHHLFACESRCNSFRNNIPYWQFPPEDEGFMADCGRSEGSTKFEPKSGKGPVARATLYFLLRYPNEIGDSPRELSGARLPILLDWHRSFPVTEYELHRNWLIAKAQGNRNPFIDRPDIATPELLIDRFGTAAEG